MKILFPAFPDALREPDPHFQREYEALEALGHEWRVFTLEAFLDGNLDRAFRFLPPGKDETLLYRGWILREDEYIALSNELLVRGYRLVTASAEYSQTVYLPNYHPRIASWSPPARWTDGPDPEAAWKLVQEFRPGPMIVKDHVKSAKERWAEACFIPAGAGKRTFVRICRKLIEFQGERFERGFVLRPFASLRYLEEGAFGGPVFEEYRLFFYRGRLLASAPYHRVGPELESPEQFDFLPGLIPSPFFTADIARLEDGRLTIIELGDGGVSDRPARLTADHFYRRMFEIEALQPDGSPENGPE